MCEKGGVCCYNCRKCVKRVVFAAIIVDFDAKRVVFAAIIVDFDAKVLIFMPFWYLKVVCVVGIYAEFDGK